MSKRILVVEDQLLVVEDQPAVMSAFGGKADIVPPSTPPKLRRRNFSCEALAVNKKG